MTWEAPKANTWDTVPEYIGRIVESLEDHVNALLHPPKREPCGDIMCVACYAWPVSLMDYPLHCKTTGEVVP